VKVPLSWLKDFIDLPTETPAELDEILGTLGHEVEGWEVVAPTFEGVIVGRVASVEPHPDADKVRFCRVNIGSDTLDVVCGAWNFEAGAIIAYATVGARLGLDRDEPFEIGQRKIRGVQSNGMICSARELGLGEDHEGIMVLDALGAADEADIGRDVRDVLPISDVVLDVSITPNRGDCMSILGIARELGAYWDIPVREPVLDIVADGPPIAATVEILDAEACPRFAARQVDGVTIKPSPLWMQLRLLAAGQRPISNVVDVSNYVMFEIGHPIHTFDADTLANAALQIRRAGAAERLTTLDGTDRMLAAGDIVVADATGPVALAGVMGGASTEVSASTTNILVEAANWHPPSIMHTSRRLNLRSEASSRFERGVDPNLSDLATLRTAKLIAETGAGRVRAGHVDEYPNPVQPQSIRLTGSDIRRLLGETPDLALSGALLTRLGFEVTLAGSQLDIRVPTRRHDVTRPADVIEEVARLFGYHNFVDRVRRGISGRMTPAQMAQRRIREAMVGAGFTEAQTLAFIGQTDLDLMRIPADDRRSTGIRVINPLRDEEGTMRTTLLPGLLKAVAYNVGHGRVDAALFETGRVFLPLADSFDSRVPAQPEHLGFAAHGTMGSRGFNGMTRVVDFFTSAGVVELLSDLTGHDLRLDPTSPPSLHPGRAAVVMTGDGSIGTVGELHPAIARDFGLRGRVAVGELSLEQLAAPVDPWAFRESSSYPPVRFDLAFDVAEDVASAAIRTEIVDAADGMAEQVELFDVFRGGAMEPGRKSVAYRLTLRASDRTLTDEEMVPLRERIIERVRGAFDARLRGDVTHG